MNPTTTMIPNMIGTLREREREKRINKIPIIWKLIKNSSVFFDHTTIEIMRCIAKP